MQDKTLFTFEDYAMKKEIRLPFSEQPTLSYYQNVAFPLSLIKGNAKELNKDITPWLMPKCINPMFNPTAKSCLYDAWFWDKWGSGDKVVSQQYSTMLKSIYINLNIDIIDHLTKMISQGCYVTSYYNERYIPGKPSYQKIDFDHDCILYGFNMDKKIFYSAGYLADGKYRLFEISFEDFLNAILNTESDRIAFSYFMYNNEVDYQLDVCRINEELSDYLNSTTSHGFRPDVFYGITANEKLKEYILNNIKTYEIPHVDLRFSEAFAKHKYYIYLCIKYLSDNQIVSEVEVDLSSIEATYKNAALIHLLSLKFNMTHDLSILDRIERLFIDIQEREALSINKVVNVLRTM